MSKVKQIIKLELVQHLDPYPYYSVDVVEPKSKKRTLIRVRGLSNAQSFMHNAQNALDDLAFVWKRSTPSHLQV